jgi:hypothetical protein
MDATAPTPDEPRREVRALPDGRRLTLYSRPCVAEEPPKPHATAPAAAG